MNTLYRIVDVDTGETIANNIPDFNTAIATLEMLQKDHPRIKLEIETYARAY
jgi:hypothetical protein